MCDVCVCLDGWHMEIKSLQQTVAAKIGAGGLHRPEAGKRFAGGSLVIHRS